MEREITVPNVHLWPSEGLTLEHIEEKPKTFYSKKELIRYCNERGLSSGALL